MKGKNFLALSTSIQIYDNTQMILGRCRRIIEYDDIYLKADAVSVIVEVWGSGLLISDCGAEGIEITGKISSVEFSEASGKCRQEK